MVYGRGIARAYEEGRDDASPEDVARRVGNVDPRKSIRQAAAIRLSEAGTSWLDEELEAAFREFGKLPGDKLDFE